MREIFLDEKRHYPLTDYQHFHDYLRAAQALEGGCLSKETLQIQASRNPWPYYNSPLFRSEKENPKKEKESVEAEFTPLLGNLSLKQLVIERKEKKGMVFCLDVMGQGGFSEGIKVDGDIGMTLHDWRSKEEKKENAEQNKYIIPGNILTAKVWEETIQYVHSNDKRKVKGFDFVTCRPLGGWDHIFPDLRRYNRNKEYEYALLNALIMKIGSVMHDDGGILLMQLPEYAFNSEEMLLRLREKRSPDYTCNVVDNLLLMKKNKK